MEANSGEDGEPCSEEEVRHFFDNLAPAQRDRTVQYAKSCSYRGYVDPHDLINEAFVRMIEGTRKCTRGDDLLRVLLGTIRSLASDKMFVSENTRVKRLKGTHLSLVTAEEAADTAGMEANNAGDQQYVDGLYEAFMAAIDGDQALIELADEIAEGFIGSDLEILMGIDKMELATLRRRLKRKALAVRATLDLAPV